MALQRQVGAQHLEGCVQSTQAKCHCSQHLSLGGGLDYADAYSPCIQISSSQCIYQNMPRVPQTVTVRCTVQRRFPEEQPLPKTLVVCLRSW